ncbi:MAG TPA: hypothetical protein VKD28_09655 [Gemmatimonadales bacterium]|nr:hypothetical protein [Gemmatimonadales bacterium]
MRSLIILGLAIPRLLTAQVSWQVSMHVGRAEHRIRDAGGLMPATGTVFGAAVGADLGRQFTVSAEALGGRFAADNAASIDDHSIAHVLLLGGMKVRPWLTVQAGPVFRNVSNDVARQQWTALRVGGEAYVPLGLEGVRGVLRGYWMPLVSVSGLPRPDVALAASAGVEWRGPRIGVGTRYVLERYDFPENAGDRRIEEVSALRVWVSAFWSKP